MELPAAGEEAVAGHVPVRRIGRPEDVADPAVHPAGRSGSDPTGAVIPLDGGLSAAAG